MNTKIYIGTYTTIDHPSTGRSKGIYRADLNPDDGALSKLQLTAEIDSPSFLELNRNGTRLYCVCESADKGAVAVFARDSETQEMTHLQTCPSGGSNPCHLQLVGDEQVLAIANYTSGTLASFPVQSDGTLGPPAAVIQHVGSGPDPDRQEGPHAHSVWSSPDNRFVYALDLGLDQIIVYTVDPASGSLKPAPTAPIQTTPGAGPRHLAWHPNGELAFVICEMGNCISSCRYSPEDGALKQIDSVGALPADADQDSTTADIHVHPNGRFLYGSNRGHDSVVCCAVDPNAGTLRVISYTPTHGEHPRNFCIHPNGRFLYAANQNTSNIVCFNIDEATGQLTKRSELACPAPVCLFLT